MIRRPPRSPLFPYTTLSRSQDDQLAVGGREFLPARLDLGPPLAPLALLLGRRGGARQRALEGASALALGVEVFGAGRARAAQVVDGGVVRDAVNPRRELELGAVARERAVDLDEDFLRQIERRVVVADHAVDVGRDGALVAAHKLREALLAARDGARHQLGVGGGGLKCGCFCCHGSPTLTDAGAPKFQRAPPRRPAARGRAPSRWPPSLTRAGAG